MEIQIRYQKENRGVKKRIVRKHLTKVLNDLGCHNKELSILFTTDEKIAELNEEYRKWNARVTHPDADIRQQADQILSLIADLRSRRTCQCS